MLSGEMLFALQARSIGETFQIEYSVPEVFEVHLARRHRTVLLKNSATEENVRGKQFKIDIKVSNR